MDKKSLQSDEALVLQSIYGTDIISIKTENCWKQWAPLDVCIRLEPTTDKSKSYVSVNIQFVCSDDYPSKPPNIKILNSEGITESQKNQLLEMLINHAQSLVGNIMIYELSQQCMRELEKLNKHPQESVHEAMLKHKENVKKEQSRIRADSIRKEQAEVEKEHERRMNEAENKRQEEKLERQNRAKTINFDELNSFIVIKNINGEDTKIYKKSPNEKRRRCIHHFCTEWNAFDSSKDLLVSEWNFVYTLGRKQRKIEVDFKPFIVRLENFCNHLLNTLKGLGEFDQYLYPISFITLKKTALEPTHFNVSLLIGQPINGNDRCLSENARFIQKNKESVVPHLASQAVCALKWIHDRQLTYGEFKDSSVWFTNKATFRFSDVFIFPELLQICELFENLTNPNKTPLTPSSPHSKRSKAKIMELQRKDLFALGTLLDSLTMEPLSDTHDNPSNFTTTLQSFIKNCQNAKSIEQLLDHKFLSLHLLPINDACSDEESVVALSNLEHSRLGKDFYAFRALGKGGFGQVVLARNKLDGNDYAIKIIPLSVESEQLIRKVTREANLLSRLNHEHVVRYYAAWLETERDSIPDSNSIKTTFTSSTNNTRRDEDESDAFVVNGNSVVFADDVKECETETDSSDDSDSGTQGRLWQKPKVKPSIHTIFSGNNHHSKSGVNSEFDIIFDDYDDNEESGISENEKISGPEGDVTSISLPKMLYIQMEFCEKNTLRVLIDEEALLKDTSLNWRIFREILSGLKYIHNQGMIHRDIKPGNIFLDTNMCVKIGDFGLATLDSFSKDVETSEININSSHTKGIGTGLYIAPEVIQNSAYSKRYDSRCDVYSVGIVLFEMFYRPLPIGMERVEVLSHLRNQLVFPEDFGIQLSTQTRKNVQKLTKWMMDLNPEMRPTVRDLLQHELVPFVESEESDFQKKYKDSLRNRRSKLHQYVVNELFTLEMTSAADYLYDLNRIQDPEFNISKIQTEVSFIVEKLRSIFRLHGYFELNTSSCTPIQQTKEQKITIRNAPVTVIDRSGYLLASCKDLRTNFARYCARNAVEHIKRYSIGKVWIEADQPGTSPIERSECSVDIVGPVDKSFALAGDMLSFIIDMTKLPVLSGLKLSIRLGHMKLIESICAINGCSDEQTLKQVNDLLYSMVSCNKKMTLDEKANRLSVGAEIGNNTAQNIVKFFDPVESLEELKARMHRILNHKSLEVSEPARIAIGDISSTLGHLEIHAPDKLAIIFDPSVAYRPSMFTDGLVYLMEVELPYKGIVRKATILGGGRYDSFLRKTRHMKDQPIQALSAFGTNISLESLANIQSTLRMDSFNSNNSVLVCSLTKETEREVLEVVLELRKLNISSSVYHGSGFNEDDLLDYCKKYSIPYLLTAGEDDKYALYEDVKQTKSGRKATYGDYAHNKLTKKESIQYLSAIESQTSSNIPQTHDLPTPNAEGNRHSFPSSSVATFANVSINFTSMDKFLQHNTKKRIEKQIFSSLQEMLQNFNTKTKIDVFPTELTVDFIVQIVGVINRQDTEDEFLRSMQKLTEGKQKREIELLSKNLSPLFSPNSPCNPIILYSVSDNTFKVIM